MKVDLINGDEVLIKISGATIIISKVSAILLRDHLSKLVEEKFTAGRTLAGVAPTTTQGEKCLGCSDAIDGKTKGQTGPCSFCCRTYTDLYKRSGTSAVA